MYSVVDCFVPSCGRWWKWVTLDRSSVRWCSQLHLISSLAVPGVSKSWSGVKESVACVAGGIIVPGALSWRRTCHSKRVKGENPSLTCSQSSRGFAAKKLQHSRLNRQLRRLRRVWVSVPFFVPIPSVSSLHESPLYEFGTPCMVIILEYEQSLFFLMSVEQNGRDKQKNMSINEGARIPGLAEKKKKIRNSAAVNWENAFDQKKNKPRFWISQGITSCTRLFADDMKVDRVLRDTKEDVEGLGKKILLVGILGQLRFNTDKCEVMRISKKTNTVVAS